MSAIFRTSLVATLLALPVPATTQQIDPTDRAPLFSDQTALEVTLRADFEALRGDRDEDAPERPASVELLDAAGRALIIDAQLRTRGRFRLEAANCSFPPLRLNLKKSQTVGTVFEGEDKLKIVAVCRPNRASYEQLVFLEYLAYQAFERITDTSFRTRLARITYVDESGENDPLTRFAFFIEDDDILAERLGATVFELEEGKNVPPRYLEPVSTATVALFQYMIGNTDWSGVAGHNVELLELYGLAIPVPYDFDFSGLVEAPYSIPAEDLPIRSVEERLYLGWCWDGLDWGAILERFRAAQPGVLQLFETFPHLEDGERDRAIRYLEAFFEDIENDERAQRRILRDCQQLPGNDADR